MASDDWNLPKVKGLKRRWLINTVSVVCALGLVCSFVVTTLFAANYYSTMESDMRYRARTTTEFFADYLNQNYNEYYQSCITYAQTFEDKNNIELQRNKIQLYCNQVFVTDSVEGIVPDFLTLLHGVIDSPDIPLNVSRSYLQSDGNVKKISGHITKKVADRLQEIFKAERTEFENKWDSLKIFINYGMLTDEKFYERAVKFNLFKNTDGKYFTAEEYKALTETNQTDKDGNLIYLYTNDTEQQYSYIEAAKAKGYDVLVFDGQFDVHMASMLEQKNEKTRYVRVDSDVIDRIIVKDDASKVELTADEMNALSKVFTAETPAMKDTNFMVTFEALGADAMPMMVTQQEFMRRMKEMAALQGGMMSFYGQMPDSYNLVVNTDHELIKSLIDKISQGTMAQVAPLNSEISTLQDTVNKINEMNKDKKDEEIAEADKEIIKENNDKISGLNSKKDEIYKEFAKNEDMVRQIIDLALLANNMLKGEALSKFVKRSTSFIK